MFIAIIIHKITAFIDHTSQVPRLQQQIPLIWFAHNQWLRIRGNTGNVTVRCKTKVHNESIARQSAVKQQA